MRKNIINIYVCGCFIAMSVLGSDLWAAPKGESSANDKATAKAGTDPAKGAEALNLWAKIKSETGEDVTGLKDVAADYYGIPRFTRGTRRTRKRVYTPIVIDPFEFHDSIADLPAKVKALRETLDDGSVVLPEEWTVLTLDGRQEPASYKAAEDLLKNKEEQQILILQEYEADLDTQRLLERHLGAIQAPERIVYGVVNPQYVKRKREKWVRSGRNETKVGYEEIKLSDNSKRVWLYQPPNNPGVYYQLDTTSNRGSGYDFSLNGFFNNFSPRNGLALESRIRAAHYPGGEFPLLVSADGNTLTIGNDVKFNRLHSSESLETNVHSQWAFQQSISEYHNIDTELGRESVRDYRFRNQNLWGRPDFGMVITVEDQNILDGVNLRERAPLYTYSLFKSAEDPGVLFTVAMPAYDEVVEGKTPRFFRIDTTTGRVDEFEVFKNENESYRAWRTQFFGLSGLWWKSDIDQSILINPESKRFMGYLQRNPDPIKMTVNDHYKTQFGRQRTVNVLEFEPLQGEELVKFSALLPRMLGPLFLAPATTMGPQYLRELILDASGIARTAGMQLGPLAAAAGPADLDAQIAKAGAGGSAKVVTIRAGQAHPNGDGLKSCLNALNFSPLGNR